MMNIVHDPHRIRLEFLAPPFVSRQKVEEEDKRWKKKTKGRRRRQKMEEEGLLIPRR
jgi:hypothetical protein